jgi:hypothetical protein
MASLNETKTGEMKFIAREQINLGHYTQFAGGRINAAPAFIRRRNLNVRQTNRSKIVSLFIPAILLDLCRIC